MRRATLLFMAVTLGLSLNALFGQNQNPPAAGDPESTHWAEMMQDRSVNFFEIQKSFNEYWEGREVTKGSGWKPFKRWEWYWESRVNPDGSWPEPDKTWKEYFSYLAKNPGAKSSNGNWENLGPIHIPEGEKGYKGLGRINAIAFHPTDPDVVFIGAPAGGLWRTDDAGSTWISYTDNLPTLGVSSIVVDYSNADAILMGTGDRDAGDAAGMGVLKSLDGGMTWNLSNNGMGNVTVGRMIQHPVLSNTIYAATTGGIFKSTDGGNTWVNKKAGGYKEIVFRPGNPSVIYAAAGGDFYKSSDDGDTWVKITTGLPGGSRGVIAVTPADPQMVYFLLTNSDSYKGIWRSTDGGESFQERSTTPNIMSWGCTGGSGGQAWYDLDIAADPLNKDVVFAGGVNCFKSSDGGLTWSISSHWWGDCGVPSVHADLHALEYNPADGKLYASNDGGIYWTADGGTSWIEITDGLPISQVYKIGQSKTDKNKVINGYQDNGTSTYLGNTWVATHGGDGMECAVDHTNPAYTYATLYYGSINRKYNNGSSHEIAGEGVHGITESGGWITPFCLHEGNSDIMFAGYKNLWRAEGIKTNNFTWEKITEGGSNDIDVTEHSPASYDLFYYSWNNHLYRSNNVMSPLPEWIDLTQNLPGSEQVRDIEAHPFQENVVYLAQGNKVYVSHNQGLNWTNISGSLPAIAMNSLAYYENSMDGIYVGSDAGVFYRDASMQDWIMFCNGLPVDASVNEIEIFHNPADPSEDAIRAGTYGRGMWSSDMWHGMPQAEFEADLTTVPAGYTVFFSDLSMGVPTSWNWTFEGGTPANSTEKNPQIQYQAVGVYSVTLTVTNPEGSDTHTKSGYITVGETTAPVVYFVASDSITCSGKVVGFTDMSANFPIEWQWTFTPSTFSFTNGTNQNSQNPEVVFDESGSYSVTLTAANSAGSGSLTREDYIKIGGMGLPFADHFESGSFETHSWTVENPDYFLTWDVADIGGIYGKSARMNFFEYIAPQGDRDRLVSPLFNLSGYSSVQLSFVHAYAKRHSGTDSLIVYVSSDCGVTWNRILGMGENGSGTFATHEPMTDPFVPQAAEDWCGAGFGAQCTSLDLSQWAGLENIQIAFETYNFFGNNLYIDDVLIDGLTGAPETAVSRGELTILPNPSDGLVYLILPQGTSPDLILQVFDPLGNKVYEAESSRQTAGHRMQADLRALEAGLYLIRVVSGGVSSTGKVLLR
ncbi:MAG: PKD domain-containing protein [Bacteroidales bacterium]|nr:PKD domain-containing protein [Bacteroidales bacterium]